MPLFAAGQRTQWGRHACSFDVFERMKSQIVRSGGPSDWVSARNVWFVRRVVDCEAGVSAGGENPERGSG
jgi:hypothetical protein